MTAVFAVIVVTLMVLPSITQAETTRSVDVGDLESLGSMTFSFSTFQYSTISISNISHNGSTAISITDPDDDYAMLLSKDDAAYVHFGDLDANMSANLIILNLEANSTYKLRMLVNDGMEIVFTYLNASSYQLPQAVNLYGYTLPSSQGTDYLDLGIVNGTAHRATLSSSSTIEYSKYYNTTLITNSNITDSKSIYLSNQTTKLKLEMPSSQLFHLKLNVATPYPSSSGEGSYYDGDAIIVPASDQATYDQIVNQWNNGAATRETIQVTTEQVITGYDIGENNITMFKEHLQLVFYEDELYVQNPVTSETTCISGSFRVNFTDASTDYVAFNTTFTMLVATKLVDRDGDGYPLVNLTYREINITKNGANVLSTFYTPYIDTNAQAEGDGIPNDNDPLIPLNIMDIDGDDLGNHGEAYVYGTDPGLPDTDDDGLGDKAEVNYWTYANLLPELDWVNIYLPDLSTPAKRTMFSPLGDIDFDDLPNIIDKDSDGDELPDGAEKLGMWVSLMGEPEDWVYTWAHSPDTDLDGLNDGSEIYGYHTIYKIPAMYAHDGMFWNSLNGSIEGLEVRYGAVLARDYQYVKVNFSRPELEGDYRIKLVVREYTNDYQNATPNQLENTTQINLKLNDGDPTSPLQTWGFMYNTTDENVTNEFTMEDVNTAGGHYSLYNMLTPGNYTVEVKLSPTVLDKQIIAVDDILIQYRGLDPNDPDVDRDGLGDGNMTVADGTRYFMGEATFGSSPLLVDSDQDGLEDGEEVDLLNPQEYLLYTDPGKHDTDGDGLIDGNNVTVNRITDTPLWHRLMAAGTPYNDDNDPVIKFFGEQAYGTNATRPDTDNDGLLDGKTLLIRKNTPQFWELTDAGVAYKDFTETLSIQQLVLGYTTYWAPPVEIYGPISDNPGFDVFEFLGEIDSNGALPLDNDTDDDALPDGWEAYWGFNPNGSTSDADVDFDEDGATNLIEYSYGLQAQSNFTGVYLNGLDPFSITDMDGDGLLDGEEIDPNNDSYTGIYPLLFDSDDDGMPDDFEVKNGLDPLDNGTKTFNCTSGSCVVVGNGSAVNGGLGNLDSDGIANLYEYIYDRPLNHSGEWTKGLNLSNPDGDDDGLIDGYVVTYNTNSSDGNWTIITDFIGNHSLYNTNETWNGTTNYTFWGEGYYGTGVQDADSDDDGKSDGKEAEGFWLPLWLNLNGTWYNASKLIQTNPASGDTDRDFLDDKDYELKVIEVTIDGNVTETSRSDPTTEDTDGDGLWDVDEKSKTDPRNIDSDGDGLPDSVEPLWRYTIDDDSLINAMDTDSDNDGDGDGVETYVIFRTELTNYTGNISVYVASDSHTTLEGASDPALNCYTYAGQANNTTAGILIFNYQAVLTPDGRVVHYDSGNDTIYLNDTFTGVILKYTADANGNVSRSKHIDTNYSYTFRETYDFWSYFSTDDDFDGVPNLKENETGRDKNPDGDGDGLIDGEDLYIPSSELSSLPYWDNWTTFHYEKDGDIYHFIGEASLNTSADDIDTDDDGLLDGFTVNITQGTQTTRNASFTSAGIAHDNLDWNGTYFTWWYGELNFSADPLNNDTDNDTIEDGEEVVAGSDTYITDPASNDTDGDGIDDNVELAGYSGPMGGPYTLDPTSWSTDGDNISDKMEVDGWSYFVIKPCGVETVIIDNRSVTRTAYGPVEYTAYGNPKEEYTRGTSDGRLNDTVKFERGGNPWVDDSDNDSIPDSIDIDLDDPDNTQLYTIDSVAPEVHSIKFKAKRDGWDLYIEMRAYVTDNSGSLNYVQLLLTTPGDHQFKTGIPITGSPGWYSISFSTGIADWLKGSLLTMAGEVYTQDANYNWNLSSGSKKGELGKFLDAVVQWLERAKDAAAAVAEAVMEAISFVVRLIEDFIKYMINKFISPILDAISGYITGIKDSWQNLVEAVNWFSTPNYYNASDENINDHIEDVDTKKFYFILSFLGLQSYGKIIISAIGKINDYIEPFQSIFNPSKVIEFVMKIVSNYIPSISTILSDINSFISDSLQSIIDAVVGFIIGNNGILSKLGVLDTVIEDNGSDSNLPSWDSIVNLISSDSSYNGTMSKMLINSVDSVFDEHSGSRGFSDTLLTIIGSLIGIGAVAFNIHVYKMAKQEGRFRSWYEFEHGIGEYTGDTRATKPPYGPFHRTAGMKDKYDNPLFSDYKLTLIMESFFALMTIGTLIAGLLTDHLFITTISMALSLLTSILFIVLIVNFKKGNVNPYELKVGAIEEGFALASLLIGVYDVTH